MTSTASLSSFFVLNPVLVSSVTSDFKVMLAFEEATHSLVAFSNLYASSLHSRLEIVSSKLRLGIEEEALQSSS